MDTVGRIQLEVLHSEGRARVSPISVGAEGRRTMMGRRVWGAVGAERTAEPIPKGNDQETGSGRSFTVRRKRFKPNYAENSVKETNSLCLTSRKVCSSGSTELRGDPSVSHHDSARMQGSSLQYVLPSLRHIMTDGVTCRGFQSVPRRKSARGLTLTGSHVGPHK